jgi:hypothetical protein
MNNCHVAMGNFYRFIGLRCQTRIPLMVCFGVPRNILVLYDQSMVSNFSDPQELLLELLKARDELLGLAAQDAERKFQFSRLRKEVHSLNLEAKKNAELLEENMTKAYMAEKELFEANQRFIQAVQNHAAELETIYSSRSWRTGRFMTAPIRLIRRILKR